MHDKILNQIEDIREIQEELIENRATLEKLKDEVEGLEADISGAESSLIEMREALDALIDEATNTPKEVIKEPSYMSALRRM